MNRRPLGALAVSLAVLVACLALLSSTDLGWYASGYVALALLSAVGVAYVAVIEGAVEAIGVGAILTVIVATALVTSGAM